VPRTRPGPSDKAGGSTQDNTPSCCDWPTRPAQHAGYVEEAYQNGCNGRSLLVTLSSLQSGRLAPTSANPTISDPSISRSLDVANNNIQPKLRKGRRRRGSGAPVDGRRRDIYHDHGRMAGAGHGVGSLGEDSAGQ
jgi:hypothetical protein